MAVTRGGSADGTNEAQPDTLTIVGTLKGHSDSICSISASQGHPDLCATSSDDGSCRIWDLRTNRSVRRMKLPMSCTSAGDDNDEDCVGSVRFNPDGLRIYAAVGSVLHQYDLRNTSAVLVNMPSASTLLGDTINEFDVSSDGKFISVPLDNGHVNILDASTLEVSKTLGHSNAKAKNEEFSGEAASTALWRPGGPVDELITTGYDMAVCRWAGTSGVRRKRLLVNSVLAEQGDRSQVFNPPYVVSAKFDPSGSNLVAGLGDGSLLWWQYDQRSRDQVRWNAPHWWQAHGSAIPGLAWFNKDQLVSFGNDKRLLLWNLDRNDVERTTSNPTHGITLNDAPNALDVEPSKQIVLAATIANEATVLKVV